jgi:hypothetical protein
MGDGSSVGVGERVGRGTGVAVSAWRVGGGGVGEASPLGGRKRVGETVGAQEEEVHKRIKTNAEAIRGRSRSAFIFA